jgi:hypothetical protein
MLACSLSVQLHIQCRSLSGAPVHTCFFFPQLFSSFLAAQQQRLEEGVSFGWAVQPLWCGLVSVYLHTRHGRAARERLTDCYVHSLLAVLLVISSLLHQKEISELWNARLMELRNRTKCLSSMFC